MPRVFGLLAEGDQHPRRFPRLEDGDHLVGFGVPEIGFDERVARAFRRIDDRDTPLLGTVDHPVLELQG